MDSQKTQEIKSKKEKEFNPKYPRTNETTFSRHLKEFYNTTTLEKTKDTNSNKYSTRGFIKEEFNCKENSIKENANLNAKERKIAEMNPNFAMEEILKNLSSTPEG